MSEHKYIAEMPLDPLILQSIRFTAVLGFLPINTAVKLVANRQGILPAFQEVRKISFSFLAYESRRQAGL